MSNRIVHIGYPKAGSSFLQVNIFPYLNGMEYVDYTLGKGFANYILSSGILFDAETALTHLGNISKNCILSNELLAGNPLKGIGVNAEDTPVKLKACGFNKALIVLRRDKNKWVKSLYSEYLKLGGKLNFTDFLKSPARYDTEYTWYYPESIEKCEHYVEHYKKVFGVENVLTLYIEDFRSDQTQFTKLLFDFLKVDGRVQLEKVMNESLPSWMNSPVRFLNNFTSSRIAPSSALRWFSTARVLRVLQFFSRRSITKYR